MVLDHASLHTYTLYTDDDEGPLRGSPVSGMWRQWGWGGVGDPKEAPHMLGAGLWGAGVSVSALLRGRPEPGGLPTA